MNRINQLFNSNKKDILSIYFCAGNPTLDGTVNVIRTLEKHGVSMIEVGIPFSDPMADGIVINKADGDNLERAKLAATQFRNALHLFPAPESGWTPQVLTYSGFYNLGVQEVWDMVYKYIDFVKDNGYFEHRRNEQSKYWMYETINEQLRDSFYQNPKIEAMLAGKENQVLKGNLTSFVAAKNLLDTYFAELKK